MADIIIDFFNNIEIQIKKLRENKNFLLFANDKLNGVRFTKFVNFYDLEACSNIIYIPFCRDIFSDNFENFKKNFITIYHEKLKRLIIDIFYFKIVADKCENDLNKIKYKNFNNIQKLLVIMFNSRYFHHIKYSDFHLTTDVFKKIIKQYEKIRYNNEFKYIEKKRANSFNNENIRVENIKNILDKFRKNKIDISVETKKDQIMVSKAINNIGIKEFDKYLDNIEKKIDAKTLQKQRSSSKQKTLSCSPKKSKTNIDANYSFKRIHKKRRKKNKKAMRNLLIN